MCGRSLRVDHVENYRLPKHLLEKEEHLELLAKSETKGLAYHGQELASQFTLQDGLDLFAPRPSKYASEASGATQAEHGYDDKSFRRHDRKRRNKEEKRKKTERKESRKRDRREAGEHKDERRRKERRHRS